jgi:hypothetical protein
MLPAIAQSGLLIILALSVAACPASKRVEAPKESPQEAAEEAKEKEPMEVLAALTDEMCQCRTKDCSDSLMERATKALPNELVERLREEHPTRAGELVDKFFQCAWDSQRPNDPASVAKRAKATEAKQFLKKMSDAVRTFHAFPEPLPSQSGPVARRFPEDAGPTPPLGTCCDDGGKCAVKDSHWEHPTWQALDFAMVDPHYYSYELKVDGDSYTVVAYGDLDCDGTYSEFSLYGELVNGEVETTGDIVMTNPLE